jgi:broad specificity phosphatase PhoE
MSETNWQIPPSVLRWTNAVPTDRPVAMLIRHSHRPSLPPGDAGYAVPITEIGVRLARELGRLLSTRVRSLAASPLLRCVQTAEAIAEGAGLELDIARDKLLGDPGVFVLEGGGRFTNWFEIGHENVMTHLVTADHALPGLAAPDEAARFLVTHMLTLAEGKAGFHVFVTHDSLVTVTAARILRVPLTKDDWPWYLEAAFFWRDGDTLHAAYRDRQGRCLRWPLCGFTDGDVIELARREISRTVGLGCPARFFLAGGAFKTLLTGRPPRDLDIWAPSPRDREMLISRLLERGAVPLEPRPFGQAFELRGRVVEVPAKTEPPVLEDRLARSDIALSAVGVEHAPDGSWRAVIHPLAVESVQRHEVLLLKPLANWKHCLTTLERMRRYRDELGYHLPEAEEAEVWRVFDAQNPEMQRGMIERFDLGARGGYGVREEADHLPLDATGHLRV